jgi:hypothetical protein
MSSPAFVVACFLDRREMVAQCSCHCIILMAKDIEYFPMYFLAIYTPLRPVYSIHCPFFIGLFVLLFVSLFEFFIYSGYQFFVRGIAGQDFSPILCVVPPL